MTLSLSSHQENLERRDLQALVLSQTERSGTGVWLGRAHGCCVIGRRASANIVPRSPSHLQWPRLLEPGLLPAMRQGNGEDGKPTWVSGVSGSPSIVGNMT